MKASDFNDLCSRVFAAASSLVSCRSDEVENETRVLVDALNDLKGASLSRMYTSLTARREKALDRAFSVLEARGYNSDLD
jgi:hypothetical protein